MTTAPGTQPQETPEVPEVEKEVAAEADSKQTLEEKQDAADTTNKPVQPATKNADAPLNPRP